MIIHTLTLNPAYDLHVGITEFMTGRENLADSVIRSIGGKGINISRALTASGVKNRALVILGERNADAFHAGLIAEGLDVLALRVPGEIRENITIHPANGIETRLSFKGFDCPAGTLDQVERLIDAGEGDLVTFTGSLPAGISAIEAEAFLLRLRGRGVKLVIDSKSISLGALRRIKPWLIKPNAEEIAAYLGIEPDEKRLVRTASDLHSDGIENVMITLGSEGALLACSDGIFRASVPRITARSTIGAGDSTIAGFLSAYQDGKASAEALRVAVSYGSAACLTEGTNPPLETDRIRLYHAIQVDKITA